ncbi:unnamed protein product [Peronospora belbahrii]|uniref:Uncharacterized protein n=1 Tax=Peronospora belbahrii TaxID=622444 RepID=A0AAU9LS15_9STRA|nr:unnamed protein product [Peronospora belbahrii]CAH0520979.1 unnamed protein product [Peronospora belbahrii]
MAKKRRHLQGSSSTLRTSSGTSRDTAIGLNKSLYKLERYYDQLSEEVVDIPASLDRTVLLQSLVALIVQNTLLVIQGVSITQIVLFLGSAIWMMRKSIVTMFLPYASLQVCRISTIFLMLAVFKVILYYFELFLSTTELVNFAIICQLDVASMYFDTNPNRRHAYKTIIVAAIETTLLTAGFWKFPFHTKAVIIDTTAFILTTLSAFVHTVILLTAKHIVLSGFSLDTNGKFARTQQRGAKLLERLWHDIDCSESEELVAGFIGTSKAKRKTRASTMKTTNACSNDGLDLTLQTQQQSPYNEPRVQLAILMLIQILLLLLQILLSAFVAFSWEVISVLILSSSHVLWTLGQVRRQLLSRRVIRPTDPKLKIV